MSEKTRLMNRFQMKEFPQPDLIQLKYPVFICHGYGAIGSVIKPGPMHDPCMEIRSHGVVSISPNIVPYAPIKTRAENWVKLINQFCKDYSYKKVNILAHSMGGLDMRYALSRLGIEDKVESLTTVSTPHRGSSLADLILKAPELVTEKLSEMFDWFGDNMYPKIKSDALGSLEQLTLAYVQEEFNPNTPDVDTITYYSYSGAVGKGTDQNLNPVYRFQNNHIYEKEGINDTFVSVKSAKWGLHLETAPLSHLALMNVQTNGQTHKIYQKFWFNVLKTLAEKGH